MMYPAPVAFVPAPSQNDRLMSAACHVSSLVGFGIVAPLVIYLTQRERSGFVARHALQALFLQVFHLTAVALAVGAVFLVAGASVFAATSGHSSSSTLAALALPAWMMVVAAFVIPSMLYLVAMIVGVIECMQGKEAGIPLLSSIARSIHKEG